MRIFIAATFGLQPRKQAKIVDRIGTAMSEVGPQMREAMTEHHEFAEIGKRMLISVEVVLVTDFR